MLTWPPIAGAVSYLVARESTTPWSVVTTSLTPTATVTWRSGVTRYRVFAVMAPGTLQFIGDGWTVR